MTLAAESKGFSIPVHPLPGLAFLAAGARQDGRRFVTPLRLPRVVSGLGPIPRVPGRGFCSFHIVE